ncbi:shikimate kinase [Butyribacter intestini]|uniref:Shikimate kinase n=2 Tax=Lachnospiraceae TaxID=186803 RepID=A0AAW3JTS4_9FIRM|nr:shikimate kinase [Butyribacter intestini]OKZ81551.1 MAG: shikimate kinase [Clostridium sp. CAG:12237_41]
MMIINKGELILMTTKPYNKDNLILIGMPGAGKSTIGIVLAKIIGYTFIDSDIIIQNEKNMLLHELIDKYGLDGFNSIENEINSKINTHKSIIATGGSAVYGKDAMTHLSSIGTVIYLKLPYEEIEERLGDLTKRGVSIKKGQTLKSLYNERIVLYEKYADITIECSNKKIGRIAEEIKTLLF